MNDALKKEKYMSYQKNIFATVIGNISQLAKGGPYICKSNSLMLRNTWKSYILVIIYFFLTHSYTIIGCGYSQQVVSYSNIWTPIIFDQSTVEKEYGDNFKTNDLLTRKVINQELEDLLISLEKSQIYDRLFADFKDRYDRMEKKEQLIQDEQRFTQKKSIAEEVKLGALITEKIVETIKSCGPKKVIPLAATAAATAMTGTSAAIPIIGTAIPVIMSLVGGTAGVIEIECQKKKAYLESKYKELQQEEDKQNLKQIEKAWIGGITSDPQKSRDPLYKLKSRYVKQKRFMDPNLCKKIEELFIDFHNKDIYGTTAKNFIENALDLPINTKELEGSDPQLDRHEYLEKLKNDPDYQYYPESTQKGLKKIVVTALALSRPSSKTNLFRACFWPGLPGGGKDTAIEILERVLECPVHKETIKDPGEFSKTNLQGSTYYNPQSQLGWITQALIKKAPKKRMPLSTRKNIENKLKEALKIIKAKLEEEREQNAHLQAIHCYFALGDDALMGYDTINLETKQKESLKEESINFYMAALNLIKETKNSPLVLEGLLRLGNAMGGQEGKYIFLQVFQLTNNTNLDECLKELCKQDVDDIQEMSAIVNKNLRALSQAIEPSQQTSGGASQIYQLYIDAITSVNKLFFMAQEFEAGLLPSSVDLPTKGDLRKQNFIQNNAHKYKPSIETLIKKVCEKCPKIKDPSETKYFQWTQSIDEIVQTFLRNNDVKIVNKDLIKYARNKIQYDYIDDEKESSFKNAILFLNEFDTVLLSKNTAPLNFAKEFLDKNTKEFNSIYFNTSIDISKLMIILTGNKEIPGDSEFDAIKDRLIEIKFPEFDSDKKRSLLSRKLEELLSNFEEINLDERRKKLFIENALPLPGIRGPEKSLQEQLSEYIVSSAEHQTTFFSEENIASSSMSHVAKEDKE